MLSKEEQMLVTFLVHENLITQEQMTKCLQAMQQKMQQGIPVPLAKLLISQGYLAEEQFVQIWQKVNPQHHNPLIGPTQMDIGALTSGSQTDLQIGSYFDDRYHIEKELGRGGMGAVFKAFDKKLDRSVALKIILTNANISQKQISRFMVEARSMAKFRHSNIVEVYEVGETPQNYFTMEYIEGSSFSHKIHKGKLQPKEIAKIIQRCAQALVEIHKQGIIHRDIKPANIMLDQKQNPKLMDFGLARAHNSKLSQSGELMGTPAYMSPEQTQSSNVDAKSDLYSLGASFYEALTKRPPFQGSNFVNIVCQIIEQEPLPPTSLNPDIPKDLESICLKCIEKHPQKRYRNAKQLASDLDNFLKNRPIMAKPATRWTYLKKWIIRNKTISAISISAILSIVVTICFLLAALNRAVAAEIKARQALELEAKARKEAKKSAKIATENEIKAKHNAKIATENEIKAKHSAYEAKIQRDQAQQNLKRAEFAIATFKLNRAYEFSQKRNTRKTEGFLLDITAGWETKFIKSLVHDEVLSLEAHSDYIQECVFSKDGKFIVSVGDDAYLKLWNAATYQEVYRKKSSKKRNLWGCAISPDNKFIAVYEKYRVEIFALKTGEILHTLTYNNDLYSPTRCTFSPDGKWLLCSYQHRQKTPFFKNLILWDSHTGKEVKALTAPAKGGVLDCDFSPNGKWIVSGGLDGSLVLNSVKSGKAKVLKEYPKRVWLSRFHPDSKKIIAVNDHTLDLWDIKGKKIRSFMGHKGTVECCDFTDDGRTLISGANDYNLIVWDVATGKKVRNFIGHVQKAKVRYSSSNIAIKSCDIASDNNTIVSGSFSGRLKLWKLNKKTNPFALPGHKVSILDMAFSPSTKTLALIRNNSLELEFWNSTTGKKMQSIFTHIPKPSFVRQLAFAPDGNHILLATAFWGAIYHIKTHKKILQFFPKNNTLVSCAYSPDGTKVIMGGYGNALYMWDASLPRNFSKTIRRKPLVYFKGHKAKSSALSDISNGAFSPDSNKIASSAADGTVRIWDATLPQKVQIRKPLVTLKAKKFLGMYDCYFTVDGSKIVTGGRDREINLWDVKTGKKLAVFQGHTGRILRILLTKDNKIIASDADKTIRIWDINAPGKKIGDVKEVKTALLVIEDFFDEVTALALSKDHKVFAAGANDGTVKIWHIP